MEKNRYLDTDTSAYERSFRSTRGAMFCCQENLTDRLQYLNQEIRSIGYPSILEESSISEIKINYVNATNTIYDLVQSNRRHVDKCQSLGEIQHTNQSEIYRLKHLLDRVKDKVKLKEQEILDKKLLSQQYCKRIETIEKKLKTSQEKNKKYLADLVSRDAQFRHEKKKKSNEMERLQERLQKFLQDKKNERMRGMEIMNTLQRVDGKRGKWVTDKTKKNNEQEMYRVVVANYEEFQSKLLKENEDMRGYLKIMQTELLSALNENSAFGGNNERKSSLSLSSSCSSTSEISEGVFEMPYEIVKEDIEKHLHKKWRALRKVISSRSSVSEDCIDATIVSVRDAEDEVNYKNLVKEQQELIEYLTSCKSSERSIPDDCLLLEEKSQLEKEKRKFHQLQKMFDKEKCMLRDDTIQLDIERQKFELEKQDWLQQNFLTMTPFRLSPTSNRYFSSDNTLSVKSSYEETFSTITSPRTPVNRPIARNHSTISEPSTAELYRKLGLEYKNPLQANLGHKQNIEDFHHKVRSTAKKTSNANEAENSRMMQNQTAAAGGEYLEVNSPTESRNHLRSRSAPKDVKYFQTISSKGIKQQRILYDFTDQKRRTKNHSNKNVLVDDLKMALFQDQNSP